MTVKKLELCNHHHNPPAFHHPNKTPYVHLQLIPFAPPAQATTNPLSVWMHLLILDISYEWNPTLRGLFHLTSFTEQHVF